MTFKGLLDSIIDGSFFQAPQPPVATGLGGDLTPLPMLTGNAPVAGPNLLQHFGAQPSPSLPQGATALGGQTGLLDRVGGAIPDQDTNVGPGSGPARPDIQALAGNPIVAQGISNAWQASNPWRKNVPIEVARETYPQEQGAWVRRNYKGDIWTQPMPPGDENSIASSPPNPFMDWLLGNQTMAAIHTHPPGAVPGPSDPDKNLKSGLPEIIQSGDGQYYYGAPVPPPPQEPWWHKLWNGL